MQTYEEFEAARKAEGYEQVLVREWKADQIVPTHTHPFDAKAVVVQGEMWLSCGSETKHLKTGDGFELAREIPHDERYGPEGATFWVARRG
jgi:quercetin dioxygenase-like cupin family protein